MSAISRRSRIDLAAAGRAALTAAAPAAAGAGAEPTRPLQVALANEIAVSELTAAWMPTTPEVEIKIAFDKQAGDEARHFNLVAERLAALGFDPRRFAPPPRNPLFEYLAGLAGSAERVAAGLFTLESTAREVNETFMALCERQRERDTVRIYRKFIQPDERAHQRLGTELLARHVTDDATRASVRETVARTLEIAAGLRARAAQTLGTPCFPGC